MSAFNALCDMLDTYGGRDKVMKALCYSTKLLSGLYAASDPDLAKRLSIFSSKISGARATLRLLDDIPMLQYSLEYGLGSKEPDKTMSVLGLTSNIIDHVYYPIDKICWLAEHKCITINDPNKWDTISAVFWVTSIYLNLMKTVRSVALLEQHKQCLTKLENNSQDTLDKLLATQQMELISVLRLCLDFTQAVSTLPRGWLWGGKLQTWHVGAIGSMSAAIGIYQYFAKKKLKK